MGSIHSWSSLEDVAPMSTSLKMNGIMGCPHNSYLGDKSSKCNAKVMVIQIIPCTALSFSVMFCLTLSFVIFVAKPYTDVI